MDRYNILGGLEPNETDKDEILKVGKTSYVISDKFKNRLREVLIDWGTFLEIYKENIDYNTMFNQVVKLLGIKEEEKIREDILPLLKKIYYLPDATHIILMMKQFMIYEPLSLAIHALFMSIKRHFEHLVKRFVVLRNAYVLKHNLKVKTNDWDRLLNDWADLNKNYELESSSIILLFLNPPNKLKSGLHFKIPAPDIEPLIETHKKKIAEFKYPGFCPKVPTERLSKLLSFPLKEFIAVIQALDPNEHLPDYDKAENIIQDIFKDEVKKPDIPNEIPRQEPPNLTDNIELIKWYVDNILNVRKQLTTYGRLYENYYVSKAHSLNLLNEKLEELGF